MKYYYDNYIVELSNKFLRRLNDINADYNFDLGDEFEVAICEILRSFLPTKYGVCRGFVVDQEGNKAGDDIIIFDQIEFPTIRINPKNDFNRKENIPIEAVYAYIEAKHTLNSESLSKSIQQVVNVKKICYKRKKTDLFQVDASIGKYVNRGNLIESLPKFRNPILGIILSRFAVNEKNIKTEDAQHVQEFLTNNAPKIFIDEMLSPELLIAGNNNILTIGYAVENKEVLTIFHPDNGFPIGYQSIVTDGKAFGLFLARLMAGLNWIRLGEMPWIEIINQAEHTNDGRLI